jgi:hypothetical protein
MRTAPICPTLYSPMNCHVLPASLLRYTPRPVDTLLRTPSEPVPRYRMFGSLSATAIDPIEPTGTLSVIGTQVAPLSVVLNNPPLATPM